MWEIRRSWSSSQVAVIGRVKMSKNLAAPLYSAPGPLIAELRSEWGRRGDERHPALGQWFRQRLEGDVGEARPAIRVVAEGAVPSSGAVDVPHRLMGVGLGNPGRRIEWRHDGHYGARARPARRSTGEQLVTDHDPIATNELEAFEQCETDQSMALHP
jgi:hypothetical protein